MMEIPFNKLFTEKDYFRFTEWYLENVEHPATTKDMFELIKESGINHNKKKSHLNLSRILGSNKMFQNIIIRIPRSTKHKSLWLFRDQRPLKGKERYKRENLLKWRKK